MEENTLSVLKIAPGQYPQQVEIDNDLKACNRLSAVPSAQATRLKIRLPSSTTMTASSWDCR